MLEAESGGEEEKVREAMKKRFVLLAEDDPRLGILEDEARAAGVEENGLGRVFRSSQRRGG